MLTVAPRDVPLAPDPVIPARDLLLDPATAAERLTTRLGRTGPVAISDARLVRAKYRIGESLRVVLRVEVDGCVRTVVARAFRPGQSAGVHMRALAHAVPTGILRPVVHDPDLEVVWWIVPNDRRLRGLPDLLAPAPDMAALTGSAGAWTASELVELAPERSATARAQDTAGRTIGYAKVYAPGSVDVVALARRYERVAAALAGVEGVAAPRPLGVSVLRDMLVLEGMAGRHWSDLAPGDLAPALARLGLAIGTLHGVDPTGCASGPFGRLRVARVMHSAELVAAALPDHARVARRLGRRLVAMGTPGGEAVLLHGDCHPKNALAGEGGLALIDLDQGAIGAPAADLGSLIARLRHGALLGTHTATQAGELASAFLDGYRQARPLPDEGALRWHTAAALVAERAIRAVNRVRRDDIESMGDLLALAERVCHDGALP